MEYSIYPFEYMRITQRHDEGNHKAHNIPFIDYADKPFDEAEYDGGQQWFLPQNDYRIVEILGIDPSYTTNSVRLETCNPVIIPYQTESVILEITLTHIDEDCLRTLRVGQIIHKNEKVIWEGKDGATAYHFHCTANIGNYYGMLENANGKWCFVYDKSLTPDEAFYIEPGFNKIIDSRGYNMKEIPKMEQVGNPVERNTKVDQLNVKVENLRARTEPSLNGTILGYINMGYYNIEETAENDGYVWYKVQGMWIAFNEDWITVLPKEEPSKEEIQKEYKNRILENIDKWLDSLIEI